MARTTLLEARPIRSIVERTGVKIDVEDDGRNPGEFLIHGAPGFQARGFFVGTIFLLAPPSTTMQSSSSGGVNMGMFDYVVVLDESLCCPDGHQLTGFQTTSFDHPSMATYLISGPHLYVVSPRELGDRDDNLAAHWRLDGMDAVYERRHAVSPITPPSELEFGQRAPRR